MNIPPLKRKILQRHEGWHPGIDRYFLLKYFAMKKILILKMIDNDLNNLRNVSNLMNAEGWELPIYSNENNTYTLEMRRYVEIEPNKPKNITADDVEALFEAPILLINN